MSMEPLAVYQGMVTGTFTKGVWVLQEDSVTEKPVDVRELRPDQDQDSKGLEGKA